MFWKTNWQGQNPTKMPTIFIFVIWRNFKILVHYYQEYKPAENIGIVEKKRWETVKNIETD